MNDGDFAIVIGIQDYPSYGGLEGAVADAGEFADWLVREPEGGELPEKNCHLITSAAGPPLAPDYGAIDDAWDDVYSASASGARRLYFYFSGHGMARHIDESALCLPKWSLIRNGEAFKYEALRRCIVESGHFREVIFLLDCCRVWDVSVRGKEPAVCMTLPAGNTAGVEIAVAYGAESGAQALEAPAGKKAVRGNFSRALMEALRGGAAGPQGGVLLQDLLDAVEVRTREIASANGQQQVSKTDVSPRKANWLFGKCAPYVKVEIELENWHTGDVVLYDPDNAAIRRGTAAEERWEIRLSAGRYALVDEPSGREYFFHVSPGRGDRRERF